MKEYYFETKEDYLKFKKQWALAVNDPKSKKELIRTNYGAYQKKGWIKAVHHIIYNLVRNKPLNYGFTPVTNKTKLENGARPDYAYKQAMYYFNQFQRVGKVIQSGKTVSRWDKNRFDDLIEPFGDLLPTEKVVNYIHHR